MRRTHQPLLDASRVLKADGIDPQTRIILRRAGSHSDALISSVGGAAKLRVKEDAGQPRFRSWTPFPSCPVKPSVRLQEAPVSPAKQG